MRRAQKFLVDRSRMATRNHRLSGGRTKYQRQARAGRLRKLALILFLAVPALGVPVFAVAPLSSSASATTVFADGFESGTLANWTSATGVAVQSNVVYQGAFAARAVSTGAPAYAQETSSTTGTDVLYQGEIEVVSQSRSANVSLVRLRTATGGSIMSLFRRSNGQLQTYNELTGVTTTSATKLSTGSWHSVQLRVTVNGAAGAYAVTIDGSRLSDLSTTANTGTTPVGRLYIGDPASGRAFDIAYDAQTFGVDGETSTTTLAPTTAAAPTTSTTTVASTTTTTITTVPLSPDLAPAAPGGNVWVVSPTGSDSAAGTAAAPWRTFGRALPALRPGDALYVRGGTYLERVNPTLVEGTPTEPILVTAYPGERPLIQGILWLHSPSYWTFDGINVTWDPATGQPDEQMVKLTDGVGWNFRNAEVWGAHSYAAILVAGMTTGEPANWSITGNCVHDTYPTNQTNQDHLIYGNTGVTAGNGLIANNLLFNATNGEGVKLGGSEVTVGGAANISVRYNMIFNTGQSILVAWQSHDNTIDHNLMQLVGTNYGNVRGYQLTGANNVMTNNIGYAAKTLLLNDPGYTGVQDGGGNAFPIDPQFDSTSSCSGFHSQNPAVAGYGR